MLAIPDHHPRMQTHPGQLPRFQIGSLFTQSPDDPDFNSGFGALLQQPDHGTVADLEVINQQLFLCTFNEAGNLFAGINWADHECVYPGRVDLPLGVRLEKPHRFLHGSGVLRYNAEAAAMLDVEVSVIEGQQVQDAAVNDHEFIMIAR